MKRILSCLLALIVLIGIVPLANLDLKASAAIYNASAAVSYARTYVNNYNSNYTSYKGRGGDCANFVSQCLYAGGLQTDSTWKPDSSAWINVGKLYSYLTNKGYNVSYSTADAEVGDVVIYKSSSATYAHATICVESGSKVASHTSDGIFSINYMTLTCVIKMHGSSSVDIAEGVYVFQNVRNPDKVMDIRSNSSSSGAVLQLFDKEYGQVQKFRVIKEGSYYYIQSVYSGMWVDISCPGEGKKDCTIQLWYTNENKEEKWVFEDAGNGNVYIRSLYNVYIDTDGGQTNNHTTLETFTFDGTTSQQWKLIPVSESSSVAVEEGFYYIQNVRNPARVMDLRGNSTDNNTIIQLYDKMYDNVQKFKIVKNRAYYSIKSVYADKWIDIHYPVIGEAGHAIQLWYTNENPEEKWIFEDAGNGNVYIRSLYDVYIDTGGPTDNRKDLVTYQFDGTTSQQWKLVKTNEKLKQPEVSVNNTVLIAGDSTTVAWKSCANASSYWLSAWSASGEHTISEEVTGNSKRIKFDKPGTYSVTVVAYYGSDYSSSELKWVTVNVYDIPTKPIIQNLSSNADGSVTLNWTPCTTNTLSYSIRFYKEESASEYVFLQRITTNTTYTYSGLPAGRYTAMVTAEGRGGWTHSDKSSAFEVPQYYTVYFDSNNGSNETASKTVAYNSPYGDLPVPAREGYTFDGWYTEDGIKIESTTIVTATADHTLYAHWTGFGVKEGSTAVIEGNYIYGLKTNLTAANLRNTYLDSEGVEVTFTKAIEEARYYGTGSTVTVKYPDGTEETYTIIIFGDIDGNAIIDNDDAFATLSAAADNSLFDAVQKKAANVDGVRRISVDDYAIINDAVLGIAEINQAAI